MVSLDESGDILRSLTMWSNQVFKAVFQQHTWEKINHFSFCLIWKRHGHVMILVRFCKILKTCGCLWQIMSGILYIHSISANETEKLTTWHFSVNFWSLYKWRRRTIAYKEDRSALFPLSFDTFQALSNMLLHVLWWWSCSWKMDISNEVMHISITT